METSQTNIVKDHHTTTKYDFMKKCNSTELYRKRNIENQQKF